MEKHGQLLYRATLVLVVPFIEFLLFNMRGDSPLDRLYPDLSLRHHQHPLARLEPVPLLKDQHSWHRPTPFWRPLPCPAYGRQRDGGRDWLGIPVGWDVRGEWVILYAFLTIQLIYDLLTLLRLFRAWPNERGVALT